MPASGKFWQCAAIFAVVTVAGCERNPTEPAPISRIAFRSYSPDPFTHSIYVTGVDGTGEARVQAAPPGAANLAWSPDGKQIAFALPHDRTTMLVLAPVDGPGARVIAGPPPWIPADSFAGYAAPAWSPDGRRIAFTASRLGRSELAMVAVNDLTITRIAGGPGISFHGAEWSPDGTRLAVITNATGGAFAIHTMNPDGTGMTSMGVNGSALSWSPDGTRIAYHARIEDNTDIYAINVNGGGITRITDHAADDSDPMWSPDGSMLAFASTRLTASHIFTMNADGSNVVQLPTTHWNNFEPVWVP